MGTVSCVCNVPCHCVVGKEEFSVEDNAVLEQMVQGQVLQAEVVGHETDGVPYVQLYMVNGSQVSDVIVEARVCVCLCKRILLYR